MSRPKRLQPALVAGKPTSVWRSFADYYAAVCPDERVGIVYCVGPAEGPVKIGFTFNLEERLRQLQTGNHLELIVHEARRCPQFIEQSLHRDLAALRIRGEWFELTDRVKQAVRSNGDPYKLRPPRGFRRDHRRAPHVTPSRLTGEPA